MPLAQEEPYLQFLELFLKGYLPEAESYLAPGFKASIKGSRPKLTFTELNQEVERQRIVFPNIGEDIRVTGITKLGSRLVATYMMVAKFAGTLDDSVAPTNEVYEVLSQDLVDFDEEGLITWVEMVTDMRYTMAQMFPSQ
jgi:hypothetical protein